MATYAKTYTFSNGTTADGGQVDAELTALGTSVNNIATTQLTSGFALPIANMASGVEWTTWSPTWDTNGAGTLSATSVSFAKYFRIGNHVWFKIDATHTIASSDAATTAIRFTLPVNTTATAHIFFALTKDPADDAVLNPGYALHIHGTAANKVYVYKAHAGNTVALQNDWSNGTLREVWVQGDYEVA